MKLIISVFSITCLMFLPLAKAYDTVELLHFEWSYADLPDLNGFHIYRDGVFIYYAFPNTRAIDYETELSFGENTFTMTAVDTLGNESAPSSPYSLLIENPSQPLPAPEIKVESVGFTIQEVITAIKTNDPRIDGYNIYLSSTYLKAEIHDGDILTTYVDVGQNFCNSLDTTGIPIVFIAITAVDNDTMLESPETIGYILFGNILFTYNNGPPFENSTPYYESKVDTGDSGVWKKYYNQSYTPRSSNWCGEENLFDLLPFTDQERADYDQSGKADTGDLIFWKQHYNNSGENYYE